MGTPDRFIGDDFLLETAEAGTLYRDDAADMPILDYHCHLPPDEIAADRRFENLTEVWLHGDHYKWRAMRSNGIAEDFCTGNASDREKFDAWAATMPALLRNPLYHWTHLELARYFGVDDLLLSPDTADEIWDRCNARLSESDFSCRGLITSSRVALVCTTDDPVDDLEHHRTIAEDSSFDVPVLPAWRPDKAINTDDPAAFNAWADQLAAAADVDIRDLDALREALGRRHDFFHARGCRLSDHGLDTFHADDYTEADIRQAFDALRAGKTPDPEQAGQYKSAMLHEFAIMDHAKGWVQQFHVGAMRNNNARLFASAGPDTGFDSIGDLSYGAALSKFLSRLDETDTLAPTILYNLNPRDNALLATMIGNFQDGSKPGKMQWGSGWWFMDQKDGMEHQMEALSQMGLLSRFVGMVTDSRSFLSYTRHEYFRRILCNILGNDMVKGLIPRDFELAGKMVRDISYNNGARYFDFGLEPID